MSESPAQSNAERAKTRLELESFAKKNVKYTQLAQNYVEVRYKHPPYQMPPIEHIDMLKLIEDKLCKVNAECEAERKKPHTLITSMDGKGDEPIEYYISLERAAHLWAPKVRILREQLVKFRETSIVDTGPYSG